MFSVAGRVKDEIWRTFSIKADLGPRGRQLHNRTTTVGSSRRGERTPVWRKAAPLPGLCADGAAFLAQGSDTRPSFFSSCGLHNVPLHSGLLPLCRPSPFWRRRHAWFHTWKIYVIGQQGLCNTFTILNRIRRSQLPPSRPLRFPGNVFAHIQKTRDQKLDKTQVNVPVTRFISHVNVGSACRSRGFHFISVSQAFVSAAFREIQWILAQSEIYTCNALILKDLKG